MIADRDERRVEAQRLRDAGWSFDRIAAAIGYASGAGARRLLHPERFAENDRKNNARRAPIKRAWENANDRPACACGAAMGVGAHRRARRVCAACRNDIYAVGRAMRRERIYELWHRCATLRDIAEALDSTAASMSSEITYMRQDGWDMPYRRTPKGKR